MSQNGRHPAQELDNPDHVVELKRGRMKALQIEGVQLWRSELEPGWSWDDENGPNPASCPATHREYVLSGGIRYVMDDGSETTGQAGDVLYVKPGHRAEVRGDETCVLIDW